MITPRKNITETGYRQISVHALIGLLPPALRFFDFDAEEGREVSGFAACVLIKDEKYKRPRSFDRQRKRLRVCDRSVLAGNGNCGSPLARRPVRRDREYGTA